MRRKSTQLKRFIILAFLQGNGVGYFIVYQQHKEKENHTPILEINSPAGDMGELIIIK